MNPFKIWKDLPPEERGQVILTLFVVFFFTLVTLYGFLVSRGQDVDYFKDRLSIMDQRLNYIDQRFDKTNENIGQIKKDVLDIHHRELAIEKELEETRKWMEYWKSLPQLPKPPPKR